MPFLTNEENREIAIELMNLAAPSTSAGPSSSSEARPIANDAQSLLEQTITNIREQQQLVTEAFEERLPNLLIPMASSHEIFCLSRHEARDGFFLRRRVKGDGHCGFYALDVERDTFSETLIQYVNDEEARRAVRESILELLHGSRRIFLDAVQQRKWKRLRHADMDEKLKFCETPEVYRQYMRCFANSSLELDVRSLVLFAIKYDIPLCVWELPAEGSQNRALVLKHTSDVLPSEGDEIQHILYANNHYDRLQPLTLHHDEIPLIHQAIYTYHRGQTLKEFNSRNDMLLDAEAHLPIDVAQDILTQREQAARELLQSIDAEFPAMEILDEISFQPIFVAINLDDPSETEVFGFFDQEPENIAKQDVEKLPSTSLVRREEIISEIKTLVLDLRALPPQSLETIFKRLEEVIEEVEWTITLDEDQLLINEQLNELFLTLDGMIHLNPLHIALLYDLPGLLKYCFLRQFDQACHWVNETKNTKFGSLSPFFLAQRLTQHPLMWGTVTSSMRPQPGHILVQVNENEMLCQICLPDNSTKIYTLKKQAFRWPSERSLIDIINGQKSLVERQETIWQLLSEEDPAVFQNVMQKLIAAISYAIGGLSNIDFEKLSKIEAMFEPFLVAQQWNIFHLIANYAEQAENLFTLFRHRRVHDKATWRKWVKQPDRMGKTPYHYAFLEQSRAVNWSKFISSCLEKQANNENNSSVAMSSAASVPASSQSLNLTPAGEMFLKVEKFFAESASEKNKLKLAIRELLVNRVPTGQGESYLSMQERLKEALMSCVIPDLVRDNQHLLDDALNKQIRQMSSMIQGMSESEKKEEYQRLFQTIESKKAEILEKVMPFDMLERKTLDRHGYADEKTEFNRAVVTALSQTVEEIKRCLQQLEDLLNGLPHELIKTKDATDLSHYIGQIIKTFDDDYLPTLSQLQTQWIAEASFPLRWVRVDIQGDLNPHCYYLNKEAKAKFEEVMLATDEKLLLLKTDGASHYVPSLNGIHFKFETIAIDGEASLLPGAGFAMSSWDNHTNVYPQYLLTMSVLLINGQVRVRMVQASLTAPGIQFQCILDHCPEMVASLELNGVAREVDRSLVTNAHDVKAENLIWQPWPLNAACQSIALQDEQAFRLEDIPMVSFLTGIDNDLGLVRSIERDNHGRIMMQLRNVFFCMENIMQRSVPKEHRERYLAQSPYKVILDWLIGLVQQNKSYSKLRKKPGTVLNKRAFQRLQLPITFHPEIIPYLVERERRLRQVYEDARGRDITFDEVLQAVEPLAGDFYRALRHEMKPFGVNQIGMALNAVYMPGKEFLPYDLESLLVDRNPALTTFEERQQARIALNDRVAAYELQLDRFREEGLWLTHRQAIPPERYTLFDGIRHYLANLPLDQLSERDFSEVVQALPHFAEIGDLVLQGLSFDDRTFSQRVIHYGDLKVQAQTRVFFGKLKQVTFIDCPHLGYKTTEALKKVGVPGIKLVRHRLDLMPEEPLPLLRDVPKPKQMTYGDKEFALTLMKEALTDSQNIRHRYKPLLKLLLQTPEIQKYSDLVEEGAQNAFHAHSQARFTYQAKQRVHHACIELILQIYALFRDAGPLNSNERVSSIQQQGLKQKILLPIPDSNDFFSRHWLMRDPDNGFKALGTRRQFFVESLLEELAQKPTMAEILSDDVIEALILSEQARDRLLLNSHDHRVFNAFYKELENSSINVDAVGFKSQSREDLKKICETPDMCRAYLDYLAQSDLPVGLMGATYYANRSGEAFCFWEEEDGQLKTVFETPMNSKSLPNTKHLLINKESGIGYYDKMDFLAGQDIAWQLILRAVLSGFVRKARDAVYQGLFAEGFDPIQLQSALQLFQTYWTLGKVPFQLTLHSEQCQTLRIDDALEDVDKLERFFALLYAHYLSIERERRTLYSNKAPVFIETQQQKFQQNRLVDAYNTLIEQHVNQFHQAVIAFNAEGILDGVPAAYRRDLKHLGEKLHQVAGRVNPHYVDPRNGRNFLGILAWFTYAGRQHRVSEQLKADVLYQLLLNEHGVSSGHEDAWGISADNADDSNLLMERFTGGDEEPLHHRHSVYVVVQFLSYVLTYLEDNEVDKLQREQRAQYQNSNYWWFRQMYLIAKAWHEVADDHWDSAEGLIRLIKRSVLEATPKTSFMPLLENIRKIHQELKKGITRNQFSKLSRLIGEFLEFIEGNTDKKGTPYREIFGTTREPYPISLTSQSMVLMKNQYQQALASMQQLIDKERAGKEAAEHEIVEWREKTEDANRRVEEERRQKTQARAEIAQLARENEDLRRELQQALAGQSAAPSRAPTCTLF